MAATPENPIVVTVKDEGMAAIIRFSADQDSLEITEDNCLAQLRDAEILINETVSNKITQIIERYLKDPTDELEAVVSVGSKPSHGDDGRFELTDELQKILGEISNKAIDELIEVEAATQNIESDEDGSIDYYSQSTYAIVKKGTTIGVIYPHTDGVDGTTVTGSTIAAKAGKPYQILEHDSIRIGEDGIVTSNEEGVLQIEGKKVIVSNELDVHSYVDFTTGNIHFPGNVTVNKGVRDCFLVDAEGSITVRGLVEAACLRSGEDIVLAGGMAAREKGSLFVGRDLHARYLGMVVGTVVRNAIVEREVVDSELDVRGNVDSDRCSWIGGKLSVTGKCIIGELGGESGVKTELIAGRVIKADEQIATTVHIREELERRLEKFQHEHTMLDQNTTKLNASQAERMTELQFEICGLQGMLDRLKEAEDKLVGSVESIAVVDITIQRRINPGTVICAGDYDANFNDELKGPIRITLSPTKRPVATNPNTNTPIELLDYATVRQRVGNITGASDELVAA